jgi:putative ABC transport system ATP-binding protein
VKFGEWGTAEARAGRSTGGVSRGAAQRGDPSRRLAGKSPLNRLGAWLVYPVPAVATAAKQWLPRERIMTGQLNTFAGPRHRLLTIELRDVVRQYRVGGQTVRALDEINLRLDGGQFASMVGPSGAGKSTLLHLLGALDSPDSGSITFDGDEIGRLSDEQQSEFRHHRVGFIFQFFNLLPTLSAWENVAVPKLLDGVRLGKAKPNAIRLLERVGLGNRAEHRPAELSGGQMQRVAVARALMMDPPLILADEPTGNLDSTTGASILGLLAEVAHEEGRGRLVLMVTHNAEAAAMTDRVIALQDGRVGSDELSVVPR